MPRQTPCLLQSESSQGLPVPDNLSFWPFLGFIYWHMKKQIGFNLYIYAQSECLNRFRHCVVLTIYYRTHWSRTSLPSSPTAHALSKTFLIPEFPNTLILQWITHLTCCKLSKTNAKLSAIIQKLARIRHYCPTFWAVKNLKTLTDLARVSGISQLAGAHPLILRPNTNALVVAVGCLAKGEGRWSIRFLIRAWLGWIWSIISKFTFHMWMDAEDVR